MNYRLIGAVVAAGLGIAPCYQAQEVVPAAAAAAVRRPNIVFLLTDDMGYSDPACYGGKFVPTPNIDRLAAEGVRYTHFYTAAPICSPSRAGFITGMFPARWNFTTFLNNRRPTATASRPIF